MHFSDLDKGHSTVLGLARNSTSDSIIRRLSEVIRVQFYARLLDDVDDTRRSTVLLPSGSDSILQTGGFGSDGALVGSVTSTQHCGSSSDADEAGAGGGSSVTAVATQTIYL